MHQNGHPDLKQDISMHFQYPSYSKKSKNPTGQAIFEPMKIIDPVGDG